MSEALCTSCGMCCDGTLFSHVPLAATELDAAKAVGLPVVAVTGGQGFVQPCPQLGADCGCAIYPVRPGVCRRFRCTTLRAFEAGEIDFAAARSRIDSARGAIALLRRSCRTGAEVPAIRRELYAAGKAVEPTRMVALGALERLLDRNFRLRGQQAFNPDQAAETSSP